MSILDKKLLLSDIEKRLNAYIPYDTVRKIIADAGEAMTNYEVTSSGPDGGGGKDESKQLVRLYLDAKEIEGKSQKTLDRYEYILGRLIEAVDVPLNRITVYHLRQYMMHEKNRGISMTTIKNNNYVFTGFYGWLRKEGLIDTDPTANIGVIKAPFEKEIPFTAEELQLIKESCADDQQLAIVHFLLSTGCRISEACSVNRQDIDFRNMRLSVTGKGDKTRTVYIDDVTAMMLKRYLATREDIDPALFYSRNNQRYTPGGIRAMLKQVEKRSHVPNVHPHRFRHTLATNLVDRGMSIQEVAAILGHAKLDTTMTYISVNQRNTENSYRRYACM
jgi:site-specific recombinase XerD